LKLNKEIWIASGLRTPFAKVGKELKDVGALALSASVMNKMKEQQGADPNYVFWGTVVPNLSYSNVSREALMESNLSEEVISISTTLACSTSLVAAIEAASMISEDEIAIAGGVESMSNTQLGLSTKTSNWVKDFFASKDFVSKLQKIGGLFQFRLFIPSGKNRSTGKSMGEHAEITAQRLGIERRDQDELALKSHQNYFKAKGRGFYDDLVFSEFGLDSDAIPRKDSNLDKLATLKPVFDTKSGKGSLTAGNSTLFTDGAASVWIAGKNAINSIKSPYKVKMIDWEMAGVNIAKEGILMSPSFAIPRLLERHKLKYDDIDLWEIHEAFASQVLATIINLENPDHIKKTGAKSDFGLFPMNRLNPNGSSIAIGHPFGATGARILSQATKELALRGKGKKAIISVCADGGLGAVMLIES
jgi:acetyl-CoA C-acetyltransferase